MASDQSQCQALQLSDGQKCKDEATNANGLFCKLHARQAFGLYKGYKRRNAQLDALDEESPPYLTNTQVPLANETFESIQHENVLREVHSHLFGKYVLLSKVIEARKLHHRHFYPLQVDYGHQAYVDKLSSQRHTILRALETLEKRTAQVLYQKEQWFTWVRKVQEKEEANRVKEQKKVKQEAALFRRHMKNLRTRLDLMRQNEEKMCQDAYLNDAYWERLSLSVDKSADGTWDPIEDMEHEKRHRYIDLIKHFLWLEVLDTDEAKTHLNGSNTKTEEIGPYGEPQTPTTKPRKKSKTKGGASKSNAGGHNSADAGMAYRGQKKLLVMQQSSQTASSTDLEEPDKNNIETEEEMRKRLSQGVKKNYDNIWGFQLVGTLENPHETHERTAPMTDDEIESVVNDIREIKLLLFSRLLLAQASLLPAALRASSVQEFLSDAEVSESDLRDLCLKLEEPTLQVIRDACADFARGDKADEDTQHITDDEDETFEELLNDQRRYSHLHTHDWFLDKVVGKKAKLPRQKTASPLHKMKVTICGKSIWNHASEKAMSRDGWLQFSVLAKDCSLEDAIQLCRNWAEFSDLNLLTLWQYFPASNWLSWGSHRLIQQLQELEFFPYFVDLDAQQHSRHNQVGGRSQGRRQHDIVETRNIVVGHMKRNNPITRRFLQYLLMRAGELLVLVRDGKTGRVITAPPEEHLWTYRKKQGIGRASKNEWVNVLEVGPEYFDMTDALRKWRLGFDDYYDVFIWDFVPGQSSMVTYNVIIAELRNAWRITQPRDIYAHMEPLLRTMTREKDSMRTRQIRAGEDVESLWDSLMDDRNEFLMFSIDGKSVASRSAKELSTSPYVFYCEANVVEDEVLFPDELVSGKQNMPFREIRNGINRIESGILPSAARHLAKGVEILNQGKGLMAALHGTRDDEKNIWALPKVWESGMKQVRREEPTGEQSKLLKRTGLDTTHKRPSFGQRLDKVDCMENMERDRSFEFKESFHAGDLEPGSVQKYFEVQDKIDKMLKYDYPGPTDWVWFIGEVLDWLHLRAEYNGYAQDPSAPWPHSFIIQDMVRAFVAMAMFFPDLGVTAIVTNFLKLDQCEDFRNSLLFDPKERSMSRPDRRSRTSYKFRSQEFWANWKTVTKTTRYYADVYPFDWSLAIRPIVAHLYRAGIVAPAYYQNDPQVVSGMATANTEPHRPDKLDLFINYEDRYGNFPTKYPLFFTAPDEWPVLLPHARNFANAHHNARFALLRLWSAPHFYPLMVGIQNRQGTSFLDSAGRSWQWKFVPKDMPGSEFSAHHTTWRRLELLREQFGDRVVSRGDLVLAMGEDAGDLLRTCTAVTFAIQTKPWLREIDLWKSFINVDLEFLQHLDEFWLD
ncbi:mfs allantoate protein [Pochonia chlamydosporia 170]|uniref:Mfs allantoate protein n=1 Tax=Pochonia chlamydosporia 170 TaxID=1380566 RepID=A0A179EYX4_METCM|nr:mfs allantoate protein [Pochonia chlamydosporia 170]OAQ58394.2 mfs allantoate protein [Pochonia chlamydosporia 170]